MWRLWLIIIALIIGYYWAQAEYQAVRKYYPDLTIWEYCLIGDRLKIIPTGD